MENGMEETNGDDVSSIPELQISPGDVVCGQGTNYKVTRLIGEGQCGVVFSGETINSAEPVALKFFRSGSIFTDAAEREGKILELMNSSSKTAVNFYAATKHKGMICYVFELLDLNIRQLIMKNNRKGLPSWTVWKFGVDVLGCLADLHSLGYVHGDVKPANIMWSGQDGCFKCFDFGLSYHTGDPHIHATQSVGYRAPEVQAWNIKQLDARRSHKRRNGFAPRDVINNNNNIWEHKMADSADEDPDDPSRPGTAADVWAFGCLLAEAILGRKLFRAGDRLASVLSPHQLIEMRFGEMRDCLAADYSLSDLQDMLVRCLDPDPSSRISAAEALKHPGLRIAPPLSRQDNILLPSPVLKFTVCPESRAELMRQFSDFGAVLGVRKSEEAVYVQYRNLRQAVKAKNHLSCEGTRNLDIHQEVEWIGANHVTPQSETSQNFTTEYFPLDLWYKLDQ